MLRTTQYGFTETIDPGNECVVKLDITNVFRPKKLMFVGMMDEIRGFFKIKHTRRPLLNKENVIAYSNVTKIKSKRRTTVEYSCGTAGNFVRSYLPENVVYKHVDPLSYITMNQLTCGKEPAIPATSSISTELFSPESFGNMLSAPSVSAPTVPEKSQIRMMLKNNGDIQVRVFGYVLGMESLVAKCTQ